MDIPQLIVRAQSVWEKKKRGFVFPGRQGSATCFVCGMKTEKFFKNRSKADAFIYNLMYKCFVGALQGAITNKEEILKEHY